MFSSKAARLGKRKCEEGNHIQTFCALHIPTSILTARRLQHCDLSAPVSSHSILLRPTRSTVEVSRVHTTHQQNGDHEVGLFLAADKLIPEPRSISFPAQACNGPGRCSAVRVQLCGCVFLRPAKQMSTRRGLASRQSVALSSEALHGDREYPGGHYGWPKLVFEHLAIMQLSRQIASWLIAFAPVVALDLVVGVSSDVELRCADGRMDDVIAASI